jgi:hypothetical protein
MMMMKNKQSLNFGERKDYKYYLNPFNFKDQLVKHLVLYKHILVLKLDSFLFLSAFYPLGYFCLQYQVYL